jgi:hypothetical protein
MIVFGHNNFKIKTFTPRELNLPPDYGLKGAEIQIRQRYAHIFWIPFFPIGKIWGIKYEGSKDLYELPDDIKLKIKQRHSIKTPWYSFSLLILIFIGVSWFMASEAIREARWESDYYLELAENKMQIKYPTTGDFYSFNIHDEDDDYGYTPVILKVKSYDDNSIEFVSGYEDLLAQERYEHNIDDEMMNAYNYIYSPFKIKKEDLLKMLNTEYSKYSFTSDANKVEVPEFYNRKFSFNKIERQKLEIEE